MSEKLSIKDGVVGKLYRPCGEQGYDRDLVHIYQVNSSSAITNHNIITNDEVMMLLGLKTMPFTSWELALVMLMDGTIWYVQRYIQVTEYANL